MEDKDKQRVGDKDPKKDENVGPLIEDMRGAYLSVSII